MAQLVRPSRTHSTAALWTKSVLQALVGFTVFVIVLPWFANWLLPQKVPLPVWLRLLTGGILFVGGLALWGICLDAFSRRGHGTPFPLDAPRDLVSTGPFAVVRNPIILGEQAVLWAAALYLSSVGALLYAVLVGVALHYIVVYVEEPELRGRFGAPFEDYCRRVPRWLPRLGAVVRRDDLLRKRA